MSLADVPPVVIKGTEDALLGMELWAASKIIGRECAAVNLAFYQCKEQKGPEPRVCKDETQLVRMCPQAIVSELYSKFDGQYVAFQKCLDYNDHRFHDCRKEEKALLDCWNKEKKYFAVEDK